MSDYPRISLRTRVLGMTFDSALTAVSKFDAERETPEEVREGLELANYFDRSVKGESKRTDKRIGGGIGESASDDPGSTEAG